MKKLKKQFQTTSYTFNKIKWPKKSYLNFDPECICGYRIGCNSHILNDAWTVNLINDIITEGNMFSDKEAKFILDSAERDLENLIKQQDALINDIARSGERLGKMKTARDNLESIVKKIKAAMKREEEDEEDE